MTSEPDPTEPDSVSDTSMLSPEDEELVRRMRADRDRRATRPEPDEDVGLPDEKQDFPIGIRPDGTVNRGGRRAPDTEE